MSLVSRLPILEFLQRESRGVISRKLPILIVVSGVANTLILAIINTAAAGVERNDSQWQNILLFGMSLALFVYALRYILTESTQLVEVAIANVRWRLADKVRRINLRRLEEIGEADINARISRETSSITQSVRPLFVAAQSAMMVAFTLVYIGFVSVEALAISVAMISAAIFLYLRNRKDYEEGLKNASVQEEELFTALSGILKGAKEIRLSRAKSDDVLNEFGEICQKAAVIRKDVMQKFATNFVFIESFFQLLLGTLVFVLPVLSATFAGSTVMIVAAVLFMMGPLANVVMMLPIMTQVNVTIADLRRLEKLLDDTLHDTLSGDEKALAAIADFSALRLDAVTFSYQPLKADAGGGSGRKPDPSFEVGPVSLTIKQGELVFIVGGNGSGKTTLMKLLTALYDKSAGEIYVDAGGNSGRPRPERVTPENVQSYRAAFGAIFSDFHLFNRLHGLGDIDQARRDRLEALLELMGLDGKTSYRDGRFTTTQLSTGQRKRLALVVACLEDRPIYVFDEVAADQDPEFRWKYYNVFLKSARYCCSGDDEESCAWPCPKCCDHLEEKQLYSERNLDELHERKNKKTIIAVSHDDRYFDMADTIFKMEDGQLLSNVDYRMIKGVA